MILIYLLVLKASPINSFKHIYSLLDNQNLLKKTCKFINQIRLDDPVCILDETIPTKNTNIILYLYVDHFKYIVYGKKTEPKYFEVFYHHFEWSREYFREDVCKKLIDRISDELFRKFWFGNFDLFVEIFPDNKSIINSYLDNIKTNRFISNLLFGLEGLVNVDVRIISYNLKTYLNKDQNYYNFYNRYNEEKTECYLLPDIECFFYDMIFESTEYQETSKNTEYQLNYLSNILDVEEKFLKYIVNEISKNAGFTDIFFKTYFDSNIKFNNDSNDSLSYLIYTYVRKKYSLLLEYEYSKEIVKFLWSKKLSDILDIPAIKYKKNNPKLHNAFTYLWDLYNNMRISWTQYLNGIDDLSKFMLTGMYRHLEYVFYAEIQDIFKSRTKSVKIKDELKKFLAKVLNMLRMKRSLYIDMCININEAKSYKFFLISLEQIGLRSYDKKQLEKDFAYVCRKKPKPIFFSNYKNCPIYTFNQDMLELIRNEIQSVD